MEAERQRRYQLQVKEKIKSRGERMSERKNGHSRKKERKCWKYEKTPLKINKNERRQRRR